MLRGDVERFYRSLRRAYPKPPTGACRQLDHVREIAQYYDGMTQKERLLMLAWAKKEESGIGMIPLALSGIPFAGLLLGARIQEPLKGLPVWAIFALWGTAALLLVAGFYVHQRQKAFTMLHIVLLEQAIKKDETEAAVRNDTPPPRPTNCGLHKPPKEADPTPPQVPGMH